MKNEKILQEEETLDPVDWDRLKNLGHKMVDDMFDIFSKCVKGRFGNRFPPKQNNISNILCH